MEANVIIESLKECVGIIIKTHPNRKEFVRQLKSGELERRLNVLGKPFDSTGRVKVILKAYKILTELDENYTI